MNKFKKALISAGATAVMLAGLAVPALAGAQKTPLYGPADPGFTCAGGSNPVGNVLGFVVLNTNGKPGTNNDLIVQVSIKGGAPNTSYDIYVNQDPGDCPTAPAIGVLTTNGQGNGNAHLVEPRLPGATNFWVSAVGGGQVLRSPAVTLD